MFIKRLLGYICLMNTKTKRWVIIAASIIVILFLFSAVGFYVSGKPTFCNSCHIMKPFYNSWKKSVHPKEAACLNCHADPGFIGEVKAHIGGLRYVYVVLFKNPNPKYIRATVPNNRCLECHSVSKLNKVFEKHGDHIENGVSCTQCHDSFIHNIKADGKPRNLPKSNCKICHVRGIPD